MAENNLPPPQTIPRRSPGTATIVIGVLVLLTLCMATCGAIAVTGGVLLFTRSRISPSLVQTVEPRQVRPIPQSEPTETPTPLVLAPSQTPVPATLTPVAVTQSAIVPITVTSAVSAPVSADAISTTAPLTFTAEDTARQLHIFDELWTIVHDSYVYTDYNGLDWASVKITVERQISAGLADEPFYDLMRNVVASLNDNHSYFLSPTEARDEEAEYQGAGEYVGIGILSDLNLEKKYVYVLQVLPDSPAEQAGIKAHDHILLIDGQPVMDVEGTPRTSLLRGPVGTTVTVTVQTPGAEPRTLTVTRARLSTSSPVESRILPESKRIGYILIPTLFEEDMGTRVRDALRALMKGGRLDGLIVDMRINNGGAYPVLMTNLGFFTAGNVGSLVDRQGVLSALNVRSEKIGNSQTIPLMVLIGPSTQSYAEVYAGALRAKGRAKLVGQKSGGNIETLRGHDFEDGSEVWIAEETFRLPNGDNWEGAGLTPDIPIDKGWDEYTAENDPVIAAAVKALTGGK